MWAFLSKIDPDLVVTIVSILGAGATWLYRKAKGEKQADITSSLWRAMEGSVLKLAETHLAPTATFLRDKLTVAAYEALGRMGVKKNAVVDAIVAKLVEQGVTEVRKRIAALKNARDLEKVLTDASKVTTAAPKPGLPGEVPVLGLNIEYVKPE